VLWKLCFRQVVCTHTTRGLGKKNPLPLYVGAFPRSYFIVKASVASPFIANGLSVGNFWCSIIDLIIPANIEASLLNLFMRNHMERMTLLRVGSRDISLQSVCIEEECQRIVDDVGESVSLFCCFAQHAVYRDFGFLKPLIFPSQSDRPHGFRYEFARRPFHTILSLWLLKCTPYE